MATTQFDADQVRDGTITNADIADDAAIAQSKINGLSEALSNILPSQSGNANKFLKTNGTATSWDSPSGSGETCNVEALTADKTLTASDAPIQMYTCAANRIVNLPTTGITVGQKFEIWNKNAYDSAYSINLKQSTTSIDVMYAQKSSIVRWDGANWIADSGTNNVAVGNGANGYSSGTAVGRGATGYSSGTAVGRGANGYSNGTAVGYGANGPSNGAAVGYNANGNSYGAAVGYNSKGINNGAAVGYGAIGWESGAAVGYNAEGGSKAAAFGFYAVANSKGTNTIVLGAYTKAERNREIVSTATVGLANKAQFTIQKFVEKDLATASAAWQELFIDGSSARLTIVASSVYNFRAQINAIDVTTLDVKTWEIIGTIKRNAANATSMVGTPTVTVIAADTAAANWDARITADDTNESLKVEVKHDSANNVRFSLNIIATETRV